MNRVPISALVTKALDVAEKHLGIQELSRRLGAPETTIRAWRFGHLTMAEDDFLRLVDIVIELDPHWTDKLSKP